MRAFGASELKFLRRLAIEPSLRQVRLAEELNVSRSAVNQTWRRLEREHGLRVRGLLDYGKLGIDLVFGWAEISRGGTALRNFSRWLSSSPFVSVTRESMISMPMGEKVYFEAVLPRGPHYGRFLNQLVRFQKKPYKLSIVHDRAQQIADHLSLGLYTGKHWEFDSGFRLQVSIDGLKDYADVLPSIRAMRQSEGGIGGISELAVASALEQEYHVSAGRLQKFFKEHKLSAPSGRTLRRMLARVRKGVAMPYVEVKNIALPQQMTVCLRMNPENRALIQLLHAQMGTFPAARLVSGSELVVLMLRIPEAARWDTMTMSLARSFQQAAEMSTFITDSREPRRGLEYILSYIE
ncbi:MAG: Lrp/AsnC family transcriptional regulator [Candidatus Thorarchaeota archaeon]|nr:MAG: Lrp/AsnC family transcriptional regulator [Candidatus Thorarchaeota archaeon]